MRTENCRARTLHPQTKNVCAPAKQRWVDPPPPQALFVDGGTLSNFPIDLFHDPTSVPLLPTLGVELGQDRNKFEEIDNPIELLAAMNNSSRCL